MSRNEQPNERNDLTATYTWDVLSTLDGYGSYGPDDDWGGYWSKQGPRAPGLRATLFRSHRRMVCGATTFREPRRS